MQRRNIKDETALMALDDGRTRVSAMALIHQKLYQNENIRSICFRKYAEQLSAMLANIYATDNKVKISLQGEDALLDIDTAIPLE
ncbi:MAG: two-component sensor histidine kinase [Cyclobacteriaceae bacterium]